jgi:hypothetical protein
MRQPRQFTAVDPMTITEPEVFAIGLYGYTGTGKSKSALEIATGIIRVYGGEIFYADADGRRGLHFRKQYPKMRYIDFPAPHNALDFADLIAAHEGKRGCLVIDGMTQEHEGEEGLIDTHAAEKDRRGGDDGKNAVAWALAKSQHKILVRVVRRAIQSIPIIMCWRAQDKTDWNNKDDRGKVKPLALGEMPIGSMDLPFEMTATYLLPVGSRGVPCLDPVERGEMLMTKIPDQFRDIVKPDEQFTEAHGEAMARWAMLPTKPRAAAPAGPPAETPGTRILARLTAARSTAELVEIEADYKAHAAAREIRKSEGEQIRLLAAARREALAGVVPPDLEPGAGEAVQP